MIRSFYLIALALVCLPAYAQQAEEKKPPVEIEASQQLEWLRAQNMYRATGDVKITQGGTVITGQRAEAHYDAATGPSSLQTMSVFDNVVITDADRKITADRADYNTVTRILNLHGQTMTVTAPDLVVTSHETMDYDMNANMATATGNAEVKQPGQILRAQKITAWFNAENELQRAHAEGKVVIVRNNPDGTKEIAEADRGDYDLVKNGAVLNGHVKLTRGDNHMQGDQAVIDLKTGYSKLVNNPTQSASNTGRVRAIFSSGK